MRAREAEFWDQRAADAELRALPAPDMWERSILAATEPLGGRDVLELGCGEGDLTVRLAAAGARVTALDLSPRMLDLARRRMERHLPEAEVAWVSGSAEAMPFADESFDLVVGKWVLHHLDLEAALTELHRVMRAGGRGVFAETSALNPLLRVARAAVHRIGIGFGTPDEHPLTRADLRLIGARFRLCKVDFPDFLLLGIFARNVLRLKLRRTTALMLRADDAIGRRAPALGRLSYYLRVVVEK